MPYKKKHIYDRGRLIVKAFGRCIPVEIRDDSNVKLAVAIIERAVLDLFDKRERGEAAIWFREGGHCRLCWLLGVDPDYLIRLIDECFDYHIKQLGSIDA